MNPINITKRVPKGSPLTAEEHDANLEALKKACEELEQTAGADGISAYQSAVNNGFAGTEVEWLASLKGADGTGSGDMLKSVYDPDNSGKVNTAKTAEAIEWNAVNDKPLNYPPSPHTHSKSEISDFPTFKTINGESITGTGEISVSGTGGSSIGNLDGGHSDTVFVSGDLTIDCGGSI